MTYTIRLTENAKQDIESIECFEKKDKARNDITPSRQKVPAIGQPCLPHALTNVAGAGMIVLLIHSNTKNNGYSRTYHKFTGKERR